jgi:anti-sigma factor RsiW
MVWLKGHVSWRDLNRLADDELEADARVLAIEHVAACPKCTGRVSFLESMRDAGRDMRRTSCGAGRRAHV